jgi:DNA integrity scanning protein DisA with diadenylate cyclase activity
MFNKSTYQAAKIVAPTIVNLFADHLKRAKERGEEDLAAVPDTNIIESIIDAAFWASLRREEGNSPKISLAFLPPDLAGQPLLFEKRIKVSPAALTKLAPGVERAGIHLGVWHQGDELYIWGTTHKIPNYCFVLDVSEPGLLVIKHRRVTGYGKFVNVAVLIGDQVKIVDEDSAHLQDCPEVLSSLLGFTSAGDDSVNILIQLAVSMRAHKHGGTLLVVPAGTSNWRESILQPMKYSVLPAFCGLSDLIKQDNTQRVNSFWQRELIREIESIGGLTAVDGATILSDQHELLGFGAKIIRPQGKNMIAQIMVTEPIVGGDAKIVNPVNSGGTRHISAAQFVHDQRDSLALVASQDGHFTIFIWSPCENMVHAHRIDCLLV